jgi:Protein of unknown function (DUF3667)
MKKHYRHENDCLNCGTILEGKFCHNCGQENLQIKESFGHMMNHAISDYFHFDQKFFHTLKPLLLKPGFLTNEYMAGRRAQYLHPVKMYIFISIVYFLLLFQSGHEIVKVNETPNKPVAAAKIIDSLNKEIIRDHDLSASQKKMILQKIKVNSNLLGNDKRKNNGLFDAEGDTSYQQFLASQRKLPENERAGAFELLAKKKVFAYKEKYGSRAKEVFFDEFKHNVPKMMFLVLPLLALILKVTFWKNKKFYVEHLIYTFHLHCFLFIFLALIMLLQLILPGNPEVIGWVNFAATLFVMWYIYRSLRVVYQRNRFRTITKMIGMSLAYLFVFTFCVCLVLVITGLILA